MEAFSSISRLFCDSTRHPDVVFFCKQTQHKVILVRAPRGWLLRLGSGTWTSPNFGAVSEIAAYCRGFNAGFVGRSL
jgi:hypothetical protein